MAKKKGGKPKSSTAKAKPKNTKSDSITDSINTEVIAEALSTANQPVLLKLCRLCEAKDGPFLNIFEADKVIAKKINDLMPFAIEENDDLPHKICFRCSAKVEELYEFVQKCIRSQDNLQKALGKMGALGNKTKTRTLWEEKLNQSNMSNDDICDALIKKAMEGIKDIPLNLVPVGEKEEPVLKKNLRSDPSLSKIDNESKKRFEDTKKDKETSLNKQPEETSNQPVLIARTNRASNNETIFESLSIKSRKAKQITADNNRYDENSVETLDKGMKRKLVTKPEELAPPEPKLQKQEERATDKISEKKPFDIMDHISLIKVNGVGVLYQCKLCNRNFLKKEVVMSHSCAKNGGPKQEVVPEYLPPVPPKLPVVKYINTKTDGLHAKPATANTKSVVLDEEVAPSALVKSKPKVGPASKVKRNDTESKTPEDNNNTNNQTPNPSQTNAPTVHFPTLPSLNSRYKLVSGPNNTFTLVEEKVIENTEYVSSDDSNSPKPKTEKEKKKTKPKPKSESTTSSRGNKSNGSSSKDQSIDVPAAPVTAGMPYPVGLIKRPIEHPSITDYNSSIANSIAFTTPAMKKQSYTIVQTGNPSKLLISTKPKVGAEDVSDRDISKKKAKKVRNMGKEQNSEQPFSVTLEDTAPPKDPGFFTFINVDPLLQPSYVLPTDNIIQESQISTSTAANNMQAAASKDNDREKEKYQCNMCSEHFSREKKLLAHIHSHYNKMDEEDQLREKAQRKRGKKS